MNTKHKLIILFFLLSALGINVSCGQSSNDLQKNPNQESGNIEVHQNTNSNIRIGDNNQLINKNGWQLPSLSSFTLKLKKDFIVTSGTKVEQSEYFPNGDVVQIADGNTYMNVPRDPNLKDKSWLIRYLKIFSIKSKPFCYLMRGNLVKTDKEGNIENHIATSIVLVYIDKDGDGIFETFKYSSSESPSIPEWVNNYS